MGCDVGLFNRLNGLWNDVSTRIDVSLFICLMAAEWAVEHVHVVMSACAVS